MKGFSHLRPKKTQYKTSFSSQIIQTYACLWSFKSSLFHHAGICHWVNFLSFWNFLDIRLDCVMNHKSHFSIFSRERLKPIMVLTSNCIINDHTSRVRFFCCEGEIMRMKWNVPCLGFFFKLKFQLTSNLIQKFLNYLWKHNLKYEVLLWHV